MKKRLFVMALGLCWPVLVFASNSSPLSLAPVGEQLKTWVKTQGAKALPVLGVLLGIVLIPQAFKLVAGAGASDAHDRKIEKRFQDREYADAYEYAYDEIDDDDEREDFLDTVNEIRDERDWR